MKKNEFFSRLGSQELSVFIPVVAVGLLLTSITASSTMQLQIHPAPAALIKHNPQHLPQHINSTPADSSVNADREAPKLISVHHSRIIPIFGLGSSSGENPVNHSQAIIRSFNQTTVALPGLGNRNYEKAVHKTSFQLIADSYMHEGNPVPTVTTPMFGFDSVGFPNIETSKKKNKRQYKAYRELLKTVKSGTNKTKVVPNLRCHGYSVATTARRAAKYTPLIETYARQYNISAELIKAVVTRESCFRENARSHVGAYGLMQLMPETAKWLGVSDISDANENLRAGIRYLAQLKRRFGSVELALAAYNAGPGNVERYSGIPPFKETQSYVRTVMSYYQSYVASKQHASL